MTASASRVISVANHKTLPVWAHGHKAILEKIPADTYSVIVPRESLRAFQAATDARFAVHDEEEFLGEIRRCLEKLVPLANPRFGWYLQQFIKLSAIEKFSATENVVVWDADTVPLRPLTFFSAEGTPRYYVGTEHHRPYFEVIEKLFGYEKITDYSFVAQCFPVLAPHAKVFFAALTKPDGGKWWEALAEKIDFRQGSGFSEYETLGTFISHVFPEAYELQSGAWTRNGWEVVGSPRKAANRRVKPEEAKQYDYCSFEFWQKPASPMMIARRSLARTLRLRRAGSG